MRPIFKTDPAGLNHIYLFRTLIKRLGDTPGSENVLMYALGYRVFMLFADVISLLPSVRESRFEI